MAFGSASGSQGINTFGNTAFGQPAPNNFMNPGVSQGAQQQASKPAFGSNFGVPPAATQTAGFGSFGNSINNTAKPGGILKCLL